jgi:predicted GIY-YIG superfamily endonuclease
MGGRAKGVSRSSVRSVGRLVPSGARLLTLLPKLPRERRETGRGWYVYFLRLSNDDIYVGSTNDLRRRFASHQNGHVASTSRWLPAILKSYVAVTDEATARKLEQYFKTGSGKAFAKKRFLASSLESVASFD